MALAGLAGGAYSLLGSEPEPTPRPRARTVRPAPVSLPASEDTLSEEEKQAETMRVLLVQIEQTPEAIDDAWLESFCRFVSDEESLENYMAPLYDLGRERNRVYERMRQAAKKLPHGDTRYFIGQARSAIYDRDASAESLAGQAQYFLALSLFREYEGIRQAELKERERVARLGQVPSPAREDSLRFLDLDGEFAFALLKENIVLRREQLRLQEKVGGKIDEAERQLVRAYEALVVDRFLRIDQRHRSARQRLLESGGSARGVLQRTGNWKKGLGQYLLALGQDYVEVAARETTYKRRQNDAARRGFMALAMVYQMTDSGAALAGIRRINEIQRYNLWQMARANWRAAKAAAERGEVDEAQERFFRANQHYLQCLIRLEAFTQKKVRAEYRRFKHDIAQWNAERSAAVDSTKTALASGGQG